MTDLTGKVALVTGVASGIGLAIARDFAQRGVRVTLTYAAAGITDSAQTIDCGWTAH